ncbi:hypothetical protein D1BOALGB6SA_1041 [Olavius sp. associated proteobacterium Delta 1]|nr:hypothetical protein D1BOALGB6SA_1041 [Olavius sp. associated proteobacterium Delta 1]
MEDTEYKQFIGMFVVAERRNNKKAVGILKEIKPNGKLFILGRYMSWLVEPDQITDFSARPDRKGGGQNNK